MDHFQVIYAHHAKAYHEMIAAEDADGNLLQTILQIVPLKAKRILDLGSGTGRIPLLLHPFTSQLIGLDLNLAMLQEGQYQQQKMNRKWQLINGDMRFLPLCSKWAEITIAGWAIGHLRSWFDDHWQIHIGRILLEMERVTACGGTMIVIETMTTGSHTPAPPTHELAQYYAWLEDVCGFQRSVIQTDYVFSNVEEAIQKTEFFFGSDLTTLIRHNNWSRLPEWTGLWSKKVNL